MVSRPEHWLTRAGQSAYRSTIFAANRWSDQDQARSSSQLTHSEYPQTATPLDVRGSPVPRSRVNVKIAFRKRIESWGRMRSVNRQALRAITVRDGIEFLAGTT
jgi:hypothetical protein